MIYPQSCARPTCTCLHLFDS